MAPKQSRHLSVCLSCGEQAEVGLRRLCNLCYYRAYNQGILRRYPSCGAVPVPYLGYRMPDQPDAPAPTVDLSTLVPRCRTPWGAPQHPRWQQAVAYETARAEEWMKRHQQRAA